MHGKEYTKNHQKSLQRSPPLSEGEVQLLSFKNR
jgi:hypothetical protein